MRNLHYELTQLDHHNHDGSWATRINRQRTILLLATQLEELGYKHLHAADLKGRHATALVRRWRAEGLAPGTVKNRLSALRWWAKKVGRPGVLPPDNATYGVPPRPDVATEAIAQELDATALVALRDPYVRLSLELQRAFGLRRSEAIKIIPVQADHGDRLLVQASWTTGGRSREIPLRTPAQRDVLERAKALPGGGALLPPQGTYRQQVQRYERHTAAAGLGKLHGLRHAYAQERYRELTGWAAPAAGGPPGTQLTLPQRVLDFEARWSLARSWGMHGNG